MSPPHLFSNVPYTLPDPMLELRSIFDRDPSPNKINLGPGAYLDHNGRPWILPSVASAEKKLAASPPGHEYLPRLGLPSFLSGAREVIFGKASPLLSGPHIVSMQAISGTGAVRFAIVFLKEFHDPNAVVYVSDPSWSNHRVMFDYAGFQVRDYPYYDPATRGIRFDDMLETMSTAAESSIFVLHPCAHNPTGCDLTKDQWMKVGEIMRRRRLVPLIDSAYQGFASGSLEDDAWAVRYLLAETKLDGIVCQSFSKSMGLYGERVGALHIVLPSNTEPGLVQNIDSQLGWISRKEISTAPRYGATIASTILGDPALYSQWEEDLRTMSGRIASMRKAVVRRLEELGVPESWKHIQEQIGMFSYTGLTRDQAVELRKKHVYMAENGRISMPGLNEGNVDYFCRCVSEVVKRG